MPALSQNKRNLDSLYGLLKNAPDTALPRIYNSLTWEYRKSVPDSARKYAQKALKLANEQQNLSAYRTSVYMLGVSNDFASEYDSALFYYNLSLKLFTEAGDKKGMASALNNIGAVYNFQSRYDKALEYYFRSLKIKEEMNDVKALGSSYNNIGVIYEHLGKYDEALEYYKKSLSYKRDANSKEKLASTLSNISGIYQYKKEYSKALQYADSAVVLLGELQDLHGLSLTYNSIASIHQELKNYDLALTFLDKALVLQKKAEDKYGIVYSMVSVAECQLLKKNFNAALDAANTAVRIAAEIGARKEKVKALEVIFNTYDAMGEKAKAFELAKEYIAEKDSLTTEQISQSLAEWEAKYEVATKEKEIETLNKEKEIKETEANKEKIIRYFISGFALMLLLFAVLILREYRTKKKANQILEAQKLQLNEQNRIIAEKNRQINDSIEYARYIQEAVLPGPRIEELVKDSFLLYIPKDIVSGDFYWYEKKGNHVYIVAADCTGHGIPGAFMSMIGTMLLNEIFNEKKVEDPGEILSHLNRLLKMSLKQDVESFTNRNGMDIGLMKLNTDTCEIQFSGANRPLWYIRNGAVENLIPDKVSIGGLTPISYQFKTISLQLERGSCAYLFSDGYADQFGGVNGKKFTTKRFRGRLLEISGLPMNEQKAALERSFVEWKSTHEQMDDVMVMGVKL